MKEWSAVSKSFVLFIALFIVLASFSTAFPTVSTPHLTSSKINNEGAIYFQPKDSFYLIPISITTLINNSSLMYQQMLIIPRPSIPEIDSSWSNIEFSYTNGTPIYAWIQSYNDSGATVWLKLAGLRNRIIDLYVLPSSESLLSSSGYLGEAPQLTSTYGQNDNGARVFPYYWNFAGTSLPGGWTGNVGTVVNNGVTFEQWKTNVITNTNIVSSSPLTLGEYTYFSNATSSTSSDLEYWNSTNNYGYLSAQYGSNSGIYSYSDGSEVAPATFSAIGIQEIGWAGDTAYLYHNYTLLTTYTNSTIGYRYPNEIQFVLAGRAAESSIYYIYLRVFIPQMPYYSFGSVANAYKITFIESGLPSGRMWSATIGNDTLSSNSSYISYFLPNGTYKYSIENVSGYSPLQTLGTIEINGANVNVEVSFSKLTEVTFVEDGLTTGTYWTILLNNAGYNSTSPVITVNVTNGTYDYTVGKVDGANSSVTNGILTANGTNLVVRIRFTIIIQFTFIEEGFPAGSHWSVIVDGEYYNSSSTFIALYLPNYSYNFTIISPSGYSAAPGTGNISWNNAVVDVTASSPISLEIGIFILSVLVALALFFYIIRKVRKRHKPTEQDQERE